MEEIRQFCELKTPEEANKEMEDLTKKELEKLKEKIKNNPKILLKNFSDDDELSTLSSSTEDSEYIPEDNESESESSEYDKPKVHIHYKKSSKDNNERIKKDLMRVLKKDLEIENFEKKEYFRNLELNNLTLENSSLKEELKIIKQEHLNQQKFLDFILKFMKLKSKKYYDNIKEEHIMTISQLLKLTSILVDIEKRSIIIDEDHRELDNDLKEIVLHQKYTPLKELYIELIIRNMTKHFNIFHKLRNAINKQIVNLQDSNFSFYVNMALGVILIGFIIKFFY
jgi:hypothetical protein